MSPAEGVSFPIGRSPFRVKGVLYLGTLGFFEQTVRGGSQALFDEIQSPELLAFIQQKFLPSSWYDVMPALPLIEAEARAMRLGVKPYLLHRTRWQAQHDLSGVYRFVLRIASPEMVLNRLPRIATQMFDFPAPQATAWIERKQGVVLIANIPVPLADWLETSFKVYIETALGLAGANGVRSSRAHRWPSHLSTRRPWSRSATTSAGADLRHAWRASPPCVAETGAFRSGAMRRTCTLHWQLSPTDTVALGQTLSADRLHNRPREHDEDFPHSTVKRRHVGRTVCDR
ncbi:MAG: hypothetical protein ABI551_13650 [Polyangiaceae bacterium]